MTSQELHSHIMTKRSFLCVGLDSDINKIPRHLFKEADPVFEFNKQIVDATAAFTIAYKPNLAFYECRGISGWESLRKTNDYIREKYPEIFLIADAKRGDIGNTAEMYAKTFFDKESSGLDFDSVTVNPYMGRDSVVPFLSYQDKWVVLLALTSNIGAEDFQLFYDLHYIRLYEKVLKVSQFWGSPEKLMYVIGATKSKELKNIRNIIQNHFLLIPGIGAQGGSLLDVAKYGMNEKCGLIVNASRSIIFADSTEAFAERAKQEAELLQSQMDTLLGEFMK